MDCLMYTQFYIFTSTFKSNLNRNLFYLLNITILIFHFANFMYYFAYTFLEVDFWNLKFPYKCRKIYSAKVASDPSKYKIGKYRNGFEKNHLLVQINEKTTFRQYRVK